ncbi:hypothetical protein [Streptomyces sp. NBC_00401]|uniref:hypothetical protein n=1 Tax=Streptomyces sp. NBC_00401 TaxID=2975738 RepID=UPI0022540581|nr:hypothetical protein [Streptomyces sp. NBC_00401]MCX5083760.1 hypothetical protein [Streptomyces sp. NBC_00401]
MLPIVMNNSSAPATEVPPELLQKRCSSTCAGPGQARVAFDLLLGELHAFVDDAAFLPGWKAEPRAETRARLIA